MSERLRYVQEQIRDAELARDELKASMLKASLLTVEG